jgi:hypothetical protein
MLNFQGGRFQTPYKSLSLMTRGREGRRGLYTKGRGREHVRESKIATDESLLPKLKSESLHEETIYSIHPYLVVSESKMLFS